MEGKFFFQVNERVGRCCSLQTRCVVTRPWSHWILDEGQRSRRCRASPRDDVAEGRADGGGGYCDIGGIYVECSRRLEVDHGPKTTLAPSLPSHAQPRKKLDTRQHTCFSLLPAFLRSWRASNSGQKYRILIKIKRPVGVFNKNVIIFNFLTLDIDECRVAVTVPAVHVATRLLHVLLCSCVRKIATKLCRGLSQTLHVSL